jgi:predicted ATPase
MINPTGGGDDEPLNETKTNTFTDSELYQLWRERVILDDNDLIVAVAASSRTEISGTGKSTLAIQMARHFDNSSTGFDAENKATLHASEMAQELYPMCESQSALIFDEAQGTIDSDGVDSRRAMANSVVQMSRAAAQYRKRQHSLIIVAQSTDWIDSRMMELIDRLVLIQEKDVRRGYARAVSFDHYREDLPSNGGIKERTPAIEDLLWQPLTEQDEDYQTIERMKEQVGDAGEDVEEVKDVVKSFGDLPVKQRNRLVREVYRNLDCSQSEMADLVDLSQQRVNQIVQGTS